ncbi:MAG: sucrase ferredoxin [Aquihabitans sp.]
MSDRFVCSKASEERHESAVATASQVSAWLLVEVHGAWGIDAIAESELGPHVPDGWKSDLKQRGIRPICIRPTSRDHAPAPIRVFFVVAARPGRTEGAMWTRTVPTLAAVRYVTDDLRIGEDPTGWERHGERVVLVCTNGKHDQCCATHGRPIVRHLQDSQWADQVWECSHIGGDRFAANLVVLPDSLYFGRMEPADAEALLIAHNHGQIALEWYRGRSTLRFEEQAAEHALRSVYDRHGLEDVVITHAPEPHRIRGRVQGIGTVDVVLQRTMGNSHEPLTCRGTPNQKLPNYTVSEIVEIPD